MLDVFPVKIELEIKNRRKSLHFNQLRNDLPVFLTDPKINGQKLGMLILVGNGGIQFYRPLSQAFEVRSFDEINDLTTCL